MDFSIVLLTIFFQFLLVILKTVQNLYKTTLGSNFTDNEKECLCWEKYQLYFIILLIVHIIILIIILINSNQYDLETHMAFLIWVVNTISIGIITRIGHNACSDISTNSKIEM